MMNGDGESGKDAVVDLPSDLESTTPGFVVSAAGATEEEGEGEEEEEEEAPASDEGVLETPSDQTSLFRPKTIENPWSSVEQAHELLKQQIGDGNIKSTNEESPADSELAVDPEDGLPEDISLESVAADVSEELANGPAEVGSAKVEIADGWNNGKTSGWASADPPGEESSSVSSAGVVSTSGVLGSAPAAVAPTAEQAPLQRYTYYMIRIPRPADDKGKADITSAELKLQTKADERDQHNVHVQAVKSKRNEAFEKRGAAREVQARCLWKRRAKFEELKPLQDSLRKIKDEGRSMRERNQAMPRSEEDLDYRIASLEWRIQHESIPLKEEKQLLRDIKALEASRESVRQNAALNVQVEESLGRREDIEEALKPLNAEYKQLDLEYKAASLIRDSADAEFEKQNEALTAVMGQWHKANDSRQEAYEARRALKQQEYGRLRDFYDNKREIQQARDIASEPKSRKAVEEFCSAQLERVLGLWTTNEEFRMNYVKDNERSTVRRLETLDGRALGPDERPPKLSSAEPPLSASAPERPSKASPTENGHHVGIAGVEAEGAAAKVETPPVAKEIKEVKRSIPSDAAVALPVVEKSSEELEREAAELKEKRRASEMVKAKEAEERKKRIAERAQLKAQAWAQKEAERKEKEREKRARKKSGSASSAEVPKSSESSLQAESHDSGPEVEAAVVEPKKVSSKQRRRGVTSSEKAARAAEKISLPPVRHGRRKVFGLNVVSLVVLGAIAVLLVALAIFMLFNGNSGERAQSQRGQ